MFKNRKQGHIGLASTDVELSAKWYEDVLSFERIGEFNTPDGRKVIFIKNDDTVYEIFPADLDVAVQGKIDHFSFDSTDIQADYNYCKKIGCKFTTNGIMQLDTFWDNGVRFFKIESPTKEQIEFCQIL